VAIFAAEWYTIDNGLELWLSLFRAKSEEDLASIEALGVQEMSDAITAYRQITVTPEFREMERLRAKARHDEAQALYNAERKAKLEVANNAIQMGLSVDDVIKLTGLSRKEIEELQVTN